MTRLHRLYRRHFQAAVNVIDEPENRQPSGKDELSYPAKYPQSEEPDNQNSFPELDFGHTRRIEGAEHTSAIIALKPSLDAATQLQNAYPDIDIDPDELHVTIIYLGKGLNSEDIDHLCELISPICDAHQPLECHTQGLGIFDHVDDDGRPFYASVDAPGLAALYVDLKRILTDAGIDLPSDHDFTPHMTIGYVDPGDISIIDGSPCIHWISDEIIIMSGDEHITMKLGGLPKEASGFGYSLNEIITPSKGQGFTDNPADNHQTENISEDPDLKLGEVEEPYSSDQGPINFRFENDPEDNIVKGASIYRKLIASVGNIQRLLGYDKETANYIHERFPHNDFAAAKIIDLLGQHHEKDVWHHVDPDPSISSIYNPWIGGISAIKAYIDENPHAILVDLMNPNIPSNKVKFINNFNGGWEQLEYQYYDKFTTLDQSEVILQFQDGFKWVKVPSCDYSSMASVMQHCTEFAGDIYSLRDSQNKPHVTADVSGGSLIQIQGKQNTLPDQKYWPYIKELVNKLDIGFSAFIYSEIQKLVPGRSSPHSVKEEFIRGNYQPLLDASNGVKDAIINDPAGVSYDVLMALVRDPSAHIREEVALKAHDEIATLLLNDPAADVRMALSSNPTLSSSIIDILAKDSNYNVRARATIHPNISQNVLQQLSKDQNKTVAESAIERLNQLNPQDKQSVAIPDSGSIDQNSYTDGDNTRQDRSIPRSPNKETLMYT